MDDIDPPGCPEAATEVMVSTAPRHPSARAARSSTVSASSMGTWKPRGTMGHLSNALELHWLTGYLPEAPSLDLPDTRRHMEAHIHGQTPRHGRGRSPSGRSRARRARGQARLLSLIHISEPTRLGMIS